MLLYLYCSPRISPQTTVSLPVSLDQQLLVLETKFITFLNELLYELAYFYAHHPGNYQPGHSHLKYVYIFGIFIYKNLFKNVCLIGVVCVHGTWHMCEVRGHLVGVRSLLLSSGS